MRLFVFLLVLFPYYLSAQTFPDQFTIGNFVEVMADGKMKIYFNCAGRIVDKTCADYVRIAKMDSTNVNVSGEVTDYDMRGNLVFKGTIVNNQLNGPAAYFYSDGGYKESGNYVNNLRDGTWTYYFFDDAVEKVLKFNGGDPLIIDLYSKSGKQLVKNGMGEFRTEFRYFGECFHYEATGAVQNGKRQGAWSFYSPTVYGRISTEIYDDGVFVRGNMREGDVAYYEPRISFHTYYPHEYLNLSDNYIRACFNGVLWDWKYGNGQIQKTFYPELIQSFESKHISLSDQWLVVGIVIDEKDKMSELNIRSSINDEVAEQTLGEVIRSMYQWEAARKSGRKVPYPLYFAVLIADQEMIIPTNSLYNAEGAKIFYNDKGEITVEELATHYRTGHINAETKMFRGKVEEFEMDGTKFLEIYYDNEGRKEGRFFYSRKDSKIEGYFRKNIPTIGLLDSIRADWKSKEEFKKSLYVRRADNSQLKLIFDGPREKKPGLYNYRLLDVKPQVTVLRIADQMPTFPGGMNVAFEFIGHHLIYPEKAVKEGVKGKVYLEFTVMKDGRVQDVVVIKGIGHGCDEAAIYAVSRLPDWIPGIHDGKPAHVRMALAVSFQ